MQLFANMVTAAAGEVMKRRVHGLFVLPPSGQQKKRKKIWFLLSRVYVAERGCNLIWILWLDPVFVIQSVRIVSQHQHFVYSKGNSNSIKHHCHHLVL